MDKNNHINNVDKEESKKGKEFLSNVWTKTVNISKKAADGVQQGTRNLVEQAKKSLHEKKMKKYKPLFPETFKNENFCIPNVIAIVDDAVRRDIEVCEGAIGWIDKVNDVEILYLYDEWVEQSGIQFVPVWKCDNVYCVDNFDRNRYINSNCVFGKATEEKLAELENVAYSLGAKCCSVEITETNREVVDQNAKIKVKTHNSEEFVLSAKNSNKHSCKTVSNFEGHNSPKKPDLKWFLHDDNVKGLIEKRCNDIYSIKSKILELSGACCTTMTRKTACAIDKILKISGSISMEQQAVKEHSSMLIFEVEF